MITVTRTGPVTWTITALGDAGPWRAVVTGAFQPADARAVGNGSIRLRELWWTDAAGREWQLLSCGNCDTIQSVRLPGTSALAWTGGAYGMESDRGPVLTLLDGAGADLQLNVPQTGAILNISHSIAGYAPGAPLAMGSARAPVQMRHTFLTFEPAQIRQRIEVQVIDPHDLALVYHPRLEGMSTCAGGPFDGYATSLGDAWTAPGCAPGPANLYTYPPAQEWVELTSSVAPVRLRASVVNDGWGGTTVPWRMIWTVADPIIKMKAYGIEVDRIANPLRLERGQTMRFEHVFRVR